MQVIGRVHLGQEVLAALDAADVDVQDKPRQRISIASCGLTDAQV